MVERDFRENTSCVLADAAIKILRSTYADFGLTLATEKLRTQHGIAKETVRQLQIATGLWNPRKHRIDAQATSRPSSILPSIFTSSLSKILSNVSHDTF